MKNYTKFITTVIILTVVSLAIKGQTNVSGGIYANTTWTLANSPYIVTDTVVVFPNVTLTIEPGVVVKFDSTKFLDVRGTISAVGTQTDSITFTSSSANPSVGSWRGILSWSQNSIDIEYCNLYYADTALFIGTGIISHAKFQNNSIGILSGYIINIDSCLFLYNRPLAKLNIFKIINSRYQIHS